MKISQRRNLKIANVARYEKIKQKRNLTQIYGGAKQRHVLGNFSLDQKVEKYMQIQYLVSLETTKRI